MQNPWTIAYMLDIMYDLHQAHSFWILVNLGSGAFAAYGRVVGTNMDQYLRLWIEEQEALRYVNSDDKSANVRLPCWPRI